MTRPTMMVVLLLPALSVLQGPQPGSGSAATSPAAVERGQYLVHHVAMCVQCHSPRDHDGNLIPDRLLHGEAVPMKAPFPRMEWAVRAPHIAGLPGYSAEQGLRLLTEGITASGGRPRAPMPPYRMSREDALAVVAYLKSVH